LRPPEAPALDEPVLDEPALDAAGLDAAELAGAEELEELEELELQAASATVATIGSASASFLARLRVISLYPFNLLRDISRFGTLGCVGARSATAGGTSGR